MEAAKAVDESVRSEVSASIVLVGRSAQIPGLAERLYLELNSGLLALGVKRFKVTVAEDSASTAQHGAVNETASAGDRSVKKEKSNNRNISLELAPSVSWKGANEKVKKASELGLGAIEVENFVTAQDFSDHGPGVFREVLIG
jgi:actin-related protein